MPISSLPSRLPAADGTAGDAAQRLLEVEAMLEAAPVGMVLADCQGRVVHGNSAVEEMVGHPILYSQNVDEYREWTSFHEDGRAVEGHEYPLALILSTGVPTAELCVHYQRPDGSRFWMRIVGRELLDRDGQRIGATVALIDIDAERGAIKAQRDQIRELNHRVRNAFTVTQAILSQALRHAGIEPELRNRINERIAVYARSHSFSIGGATPASAANGLVDQIVDPPSPSQLTIEGDPLRFDPTMTPLFALLLSELADNARRHGAWSDRARPDAKVHVGWRREGEGLRFTWHETGGPTAPSPRVSGFGDFIALRALPAETGGKAEQNAGAGVWTYTLDMPADRLG